MTALLIRTAVMAAALAATSPAVAQTADPWRGPDATTLRYGYDDKAHVVGVGGRWTLMPTVDRLPGAPSFFVDGGVDVWHGPDAPSGNRWVGDFSAMAGLRWRFPSNDAWFVEGVFGPNVLTQTRINNREFGIAFQFGTRVAAGVAFGEGRRYELAAFLQHVSNARLAEPNDGITFVGAELRYRLR